MSKARSGKERRAKRRAAKRRAYRARRRERDAAVVAAGQGNGAEASA